MTGGCDWRNGEHSMARNHSHRVGVIENWLAVDDRMNRKHQELTWQANLGRVPTAVLMESLLNSLERLIWPDRPFQLPEFVSRELNRPVPAVELRRVEVDLDRETYSDQEVVKSSIGLIDDQAEKLRRLKPGEQPYAFPCVTIPEWNHLSFLERWNRVRPHLVTWGTC